MRRTKSQKPPRDERNEQANQHGRKENTERNRPPTLVGNTGNRALEIAKDLEGNDTWDIATLNKHGDVLTTAKNKGPKEVEQAITTFGNAEAKKLGYIPRKRPIGITWAAMRIAAGDKPMIVPFKGRDLWLYVTRVGIDTYHLWVVEPWGSKQIGPHAQNGRITSEIVLRIRQSKSENIHPHNTGPPY